MISATTSFELILVMIGAILLGILTSHINHKLFCFNQRIEWMQEDIGEIKKDIHSLATTKED